MRQEETLDPEDWEEVRAIGHRMLDDLLDWLRGVRERPVWRPLPEDAREKLREPLPVEPSGMRQTYEDFVKYVMPYPWGNIHPRFWAMVNGTGTAFGMLADMLAAGMNSNVAFGDQSPVYVELQVLDWCKEMFGFPPDSSGILVSGGSMANLVGLAVARNARAGVEVSKYGLQGAASRSVLYGSMEMHSSVQKAVELLGLGDDALRRIPVDAEYRMDIGALKAAIAEDRAEGLRPFCVVGCAGTVGTGATDDLEQLAELCREEKLWLHVDGAFGALAALSPKLRPAIRGLERADSLAFDLHKWMYMPYDVGGALVRHSQEHQRTFSPAGSYLAGFSRGPASGARLNEHGVELSRSFRALKVWMSIKEHGIDKYRRMVEQNVEQAQYLAALVDMAPELERLAPAPLNIVCFRFVGAGQPDAVLNDLNRELLLRLHDGGDAVPSSVLLGGKFALRCAITNHRSRREDFDLLVREVIRLGRELETEFPKSA